MFDFQICEPCGNAVPTVEVDGDIYCEGCYTAYPELADPIF